jgi:hypothetical protein
MASDSDSGDDEDEDEEEDDDNLYVQLRSLLAQLTLSATASIRPDKFWRAVKVGSVFLLARFARLHPDLTCAVFAEGGGGRCLVSRCVMLGCKTCGCKEGLRARACFICSILDMCHELCCAWTVFTLRLTQNGVDQSDMCDHNALLYWTRQVLAVWK